MQQHKAQVNIETDATNKRHKVIIFVIHIFIIEIFKIQQCEYIDGSTDVFPSKPNFCNLFEFSATKSTQKSIFSTP